MLIYCIVLPFLVALLPEVFAYPQNMDETNFIFGAIGDSWASGVSYSSDTQYNHDPACSRYKYAWSTVLDARYTEWAPDKNKKPQFEFKACSGAKMEDMMDQMDELTKPKVIFMEVGGNNAVFYPMADACLFHGDLSKTYGTRFEDDSSKEPTGLCMREVNLVRSRLVDPGFQKRYEQLIHDWKGHKAVMGNDATLFVHGYPWFFGPALDGYCDTINFNVIYNRFEIQNVVKGLRLEFNTLIDLMNAAIKRAVESFHDPKIQYIDINPAFDGHRFCEPGHDNWSQFNGNDNVWIWNAPVRYYVTIWNGKESHSYDTYTDKLPQDLINKVIDYPDGRAQQFGLDWIQAFHNPSFPDLRIEYKTNNLDPLTDNRDLEAFGASKFRTLHPTQSGHNAMGDRIIKTLQTYYGTIGAPGPCPADCDCSGGVPRCT